MKMLTIQLAALCFFLFSLYLTAVWL